MRTTTERRKSPKTIALVTFAIVALTLCAFQLQGWARFEGRVKSLSLDLARPDGLILTRSLSRLPGDLLRVPLLRDLLTRDLVFYYEHNEDRLSLAGSLRRIAFEHDLQWNDRLIERVLDEPAELAFWRDSKNAAEYTLIAMTRNSLAKVLQEAATIAMKDSQLKLATHIDAGGKRLPVYALSYGRNRTLLIVASGDRIVMLSDPGMLLTAADQADPKAEAVVAQLLAGTPEAQRLYQRVFALPEGAASHRVALSAQFISFGYQHFFPDLEVLRFDFGPSGWSTHARLVNKNGASSEEVPTADVLRALPAHPAACTTLPVDWKRVEAFAGKSGKMPAPPRFKGSAAVCWYAESELHMPLVAAELAGTPDAATDSALRGLFAYAIAGVDEAPEGTPGKAVIWQRRANARHAPVQDGNERYFLTTLAREGRTVLFSPNATLVRRALDTLSRRYPSVADELPKDASGTTLAVLTPKAIGELVFVSTLAVLDQPSFKDAAQTQLAPRLAAIAKYPAYRVSLAGSVNAASGWQPVRWEAIAVRP